MEAVNREETLRRIDGQMLDLFRRRMEVCASAGDADLPLPESAQASGSLEQEFCQALAGLSRQAQQGAKKWTPAMERSRTEIRTLLRNSVLPKEGARIIYQGRPGAYGEEAAIGFFGEDCCRTNARSFEGVFQAIREGLGEFGVLPIENSSTGSINDVYDLLGRYGCSIVGEQIVHVEHALMAPKGASIGSITEVHSHEQGLAQCRGWLSRYPQWEQYAELNTAVAAKLAAERNDPSVAAIASPRAAALMGLEILAERINDNSMNYTRFVIVAEKGWVEDHCNKISVIFTIPNEEGSLYRIISIFAASGLNLLKLESRPIHGRSWEYSFFADFSGNLRDPGMDTVLNRLIESTVSLRILGNYEAAHI